MATQISRRKGTSAEIADFKGVMGEITVNETKRALHVHDGITLGGNRTLMESELGAVSGVASLGADQILLNGQLPGRLQSNPALVTDLDAINADGHYRHALGATGQPIAAAGVVEHLKSDTRAIQNWYQLGATVRYTRFHNGVSWSAWTLISIAAAYDIKVVADRAALKALDPNTITVAYLKEDLRAGTFVWVPGDLSALVAVDTQEGLFIKANSVNANLGAWARRRDTFIHNVFWFGAKGDATADDTAGIQGAFAVAQAMSGGTIFFPVGKYKTTAPIVYTDSSVLRSLRVEGEVQGGVEIHCTGAGNGFTFTLGANSDQRSNSLTMRNLLISSRSGRTSGGAAIRIDRVALASIQVAPTNILEAVHVIQEGGTYWQYGIHTKNAEDCYFNRCYIMQFGASATANIRIENDNDKPSFGASFFQCSFNGAQFGIQQTGWLESLYLTDCAIVGSRDCLSLTGAGTTNGNPHLTIKGSHLNAKRYCVIAFQWRAIWVTGSDIYAGVGTGDEAGTGILIQSGNKVVISDCKVEVGAPALAKGGISLIDVSEATLSGNVLSGLSAGGIAITGSASKAITVTGNLIQGYVDGTPNDTGIYVAGVHAFGSIVITGNHIDYFATGITLSAENSIVSLNTVRRCTSGVGASGSNTISVNNVVAA